MYKCILIYIGNGLQLKEKVNKSAGGWLGRDMIGSGRGGSAVYEGGYRPLTIYEAEGVIT